MLGELLDIGGNLFSGFLGSREKRNDRLHSEKMYRNRVQWTVEDAKKAGIHPLYALGGSGAGSGPATVTGNPMGEAIARAGQAANRGITQAYQQRQQKIYNDAAIKEMESRTALNEAQALQIARSDAPGQKSSPVARDVLGLLTTPEMAAAGIEKVPSRVVAADPENPHREAGSTPATKRMTITKDGQQVDVPNELLSQALESAGGLWWMARDLVQEAMQRTDNLDQAQEWIKNNDPRQQQHRRSHGRQKRRGTKTKNFGWHPFFEKHFGRRSKGSRGRNRRR